MYIRIGLSAGEPIEEHGDLFGTAVQLAAKLCTHAEPSQIIAAQVVRDHCEGEVLPFFDMGEVTPKGFEKVMTIYKVEW